MEDDDIYVLLCSLYSMFKAYLRKQFTVVCRFTDLLSMTVEKTILRIHVAVVCGAKTDAVSALDMLFSLDQPPSPQEFNALLTVLDGNLGKSLRPVITINVPGVYIA